jgi:hypothetical protein
MTRATPIWRAQDIRDWERQAVEAAREAARPAQLLSLAHSVELAGVSTYANEPP